MLAKILKDTCRITINENEPNTDGENKCGLKIVPDNYSVGKIV